MRDRVRTDKRDWVKADEGPDEAALDPLPWLKRCVSPCGAECEAMCEAVCVPSTA